MNECEDLSGETRPDILLRCYQSLACELMETRKRLAELEAAAIGVIHARDECPLTASGRMEFVNLSAAIAELNRIVIANPSPGGAGEESK